MGEFALGYAHPSTIVIVDDSASFLRNLELLVPHGLLYKMFDDPSEAFAHLNNNTDSNSLFRDAVSYERDYDSGITVFINFDTIECAMMDVNRFNRPTVLITDYMMPMMDGLQLCENISNPLVKKILLTGQADQELAVDAFNKGVIDRFVLKSEANAATKVFEYAIELQSEYFASFQNEFLRTTFAKNDFFGDQRLTESVARLKSDLGCVEHYLARNPFGYLLVTADGRLFRLVLIPESSQIKSLVMMEKYGAPSEYTDKISLGTHSLVFYGREDMVSDITTIFWDEAVLECTTVTSNSKWYFVIDPDPPENIDYIPELSCFDSVLFGS